MPLRAPIFIVGPPRTGTTLLARILERHPEIFVGGETHFFEDVYSRRRRLGDPSDAHAKSAIVARVATLYGRFNEPTAQRGIDALLAQPALRARLCAADSYAALFAELMSIQAEAAGRRRWVNHCPRDLFHLSEVRAFFPDAKIVACVRDVRGFLASYKHQWKTAEPSSAARKRKIYHPILTSLLWRASIERVCSAQRWLGTESLLVVHYERLVGDPRAEVQRLCAFLGEPMHEDSLPELKDNSSFAGAQGGVFASSRDRWREEISAEEVYVAQAVAGARLRQLGYAWERTRPNPLVVAAMLLTFPLATARALHANRRLRGPLLPYVRTRLAAMLRRDGGASIRAAAGQDGFDRRQDQPRVQGQAAASDVTQVERDLAGKR